MDATREVYRLRGSVTYREFILSPDITDKADVDTIRTLAIKWCEENFPDAEAAIILHGDNKECLAKGKEGIVHAHCIINTVDLETGRKVVLPNDKVRVLHNSAQRIGEELGLSAQPDYVQGERLQSKQSRKRTLCERQIELRAATSWKSTVRNMALQALSISTSAAEFKNCLDKADVDVIVDRGRVYLADRDNPTLACRADKLDAQLSSKNLVVVFQQHTDQPEKTKSLEQAIKREFAQASQMRKEAQNYDQKCRKALAEYKETTKAYKGKSLNVFPKLHLPSPKTPAEKARFEEVKGYFGRAARKTCEQYAKRSPSKSKPTQQHTSAPNKSTPTRSPQRSQSRGR